MNSRYLVVMAGGRGERFWPKSRLQRPKHLLPIVGDKPMLAQTVERLDGLLPRENILVITNKEQQAAIAETLPDLPPENIIGEPVGRDTTAAVGLAMLLVAHRNPDATFAMLPADHVIHDTAGFQEVIDAAFVAAENERCLVTIGVPPTEPATGYGYIERGKPHSEAAGKTIYQVSRFVEKPELETAKQYLASGNYCWNAGMFVWQGAAIDEALTNLAPEVRTGLRPIETGLANGESIEKLLEESYSALPKISIDYAVMEKASNVVMIESVFDWDDVGAWPAIERHFPRDEHGNTVQGETLLEGAGNNIVISDSDHLVAAVGVDDLIIIHTADATLVCRKDRAQEIKKVVQRLAESPKHKNRI